MNFRTALLALSTASVAAMKDQFHYSRPGMLDGPSMWIFGSGGLNIYSPDGSKELKSSPP